MASINKLMKQAMRAQQQAQEVEEAMANRTVEASSGGGAVKVVATCKGKLTSIKIEREAVDPGDSQLVSPTGERGDELVRVIAAGRQKADH